MIYKIMKLVLEKSMNLCKLSWLIFLSFWLMKVNIKKEEELVYCSKK